MKLMFIALSILIVGCGSGVNPALKPYADAFYSECERFQKSCPIVYEIQFQDLKKGRDGYCEHDPLGKRVLIDPEVWEGLKEEQKQLLLIHELGHCSLGKKHGTGIMSTSAISDRLVREWRSHREKLLSDLFSR